MAYGSELNQVWTNLIDNAIDAVKGVGKICMAPAWITTNWLSKSWMMDLVFPGRQSHMFEPFSRRNP
jgi:C4-dicarboxylate-specific signal transduction histidine kinase